MSGMSLAEPKAVLYLDIDGTVRQGKDDALGKFVNGPDDVVVFPEATARMKAWKDDGGRIVGVSNQGGIALGHFTEDVCLAAFKRTNQQADRLFDTISWCQHHPDSPDPLARRCYCRKPRAGLIFKAADDLGRRHPREFYPPAMGLMVGDRPEDRECARAANLDFMWAADWRAGSTDRLSP